MYEADTIPGKSLIDYLVIFDPAQRINILYLISALGLALVSYWSFRFSKDEERPATERGFLAYVFPKKVYLHQSALQDYLFAVVNVVVYYFIIVNLLIGANAVASIMHQVFIAVFGILEKPILVTPYAKVIFTVLSILAFDFALFWQHKLMHKIPVLWEFHKVHHSAEVLTPVTLYRMHPVDLALGGFFAAVFGGAIYGLFWYLTGNQPQEYVVLGLNVVVFLFYIFGYNLRHSQIWFNYPGWLSHILVSPAQHQIHHSTNPKHFDRNMGVIFSFWDKFSGSLYVPKKYEKLEYGIDRQTPNPFNSVWDLYIVPFKGAWASLKNQADRAAIFPVILLVGFAAMFLLSMNSVIKSKTLPSVNIEDLTWVEIKDAMNEGFDTVIIPTGGTEQGGSHLAEGKHNYIAHYTAEKIAQKIGHTFVAPVLAYVPEGPISPPDDNMVLPGTISIPDSVYEGVLRAAAESYIQHGFKNIFFIGENLRNQSPQERAARDLMRVWGKKGVQIVQVGDYYAKNGQVEWLLSQGFTKEEIGTHAGIRDTSELMFVHPKSVRRPAPEEINQLGSNGDYRMARKNIGEKMIDLKIEAAVKQIEHYLADRTKD